MTIRHSHVDINLSVNGSVHAKRVPVRLTLTRFLREILSLTGTHAGCEQGVCGACTVLMDGVAVRSCQLHAPQYDGGVILTIEGVGTVNHLHHVQQGFLDSNSVQCGFCTPGMVMSALELLNMNPNPTREQAKDAIKGNLCRCTGYERIIDGIMRAAELMRGL